MKLFTIGDSISQGFMSGAAARTDLCYSTLLAGSLGLKPEEYRYPDWPVGGHPVNIERVLRRLNRLYGSDIKGPIEWPMALLRVASLLDEAEDLYERGARAIDKPVAGATRYFHNVAVRGFDVADANLVNGALCRAQIAGESGAGDGFFATPNASLYRTALDVLNPSRDPKLDANSPLTWLAEHCADKHEKTGGVENLIVWLGANNALGTILDMKLCPTPNDPAAVRALSQPERQKFNLWEPAVFADEIGRMLDAVDATMQKNKAPDWRVFVGNVPAVSIAPLARGVGEASIRPDPFGVLPEAKYFKFYTYFLFDESAAQKSQVPKLKLDDIYRVDQYINEYNKAIAAKIKALNKGLAKPRYFLVDVCALLLRAAYKRNNGMPAADALPVPLRTLFPVPNTKFYFAEPAGHVTEGGLFSLDGVHPSAIGQGVLAEEFKRVMSAAGVKFAKPLDWPAIIAADTLWNQPITLMRELYQHEKLLELVLLLIQKFSRLKKAL